MWSPKLHILARSGNDLVFLPGPVCPLRLQLSAPSLPLPSRASPREAAAPGLRGRLLSRLPSPLGVRLGCCRSDLQFLYCACWFLGKVILLFAWGWWCRVFTLLRGKPQDPTSLPSGGLGRVGQSGRSSPLPRLFTATPRKAAWSQRRWRLSELSGAFLLKGKWGLIV